MSLDYRHVSIGSLNMPPSSAIHGAMPLKHSTASPNAVMARFDGPRSPPGRQSEPRGVPTEHLLVLPTDGE